MKHLITIIILFSAFGSAQCLGPKAAIGIKPGINFTTYDPDNGGESLSGIGLNIGLGVGLDIGSFGIEIAPSFRTTDYSVTNETWNTTLSWHYNNFYLPVRAKLIANLPGVAPFLGLGTAFDFQRSGYWELKVGDADPEHWDISSDDLENDVFVSIILGSDIKLHNTKIAPELAFDYNLTAEVEETANQNEKNYDLTFSLGFYYSP